VIFFLLGAFSASGQTLNWGLGGAGGSGTWINDGTTANWFDGTTDVIWTQNSTAIFGGTTGTVDISGAVTAAGLVFNTTNYIIQGGNLDFSTGAVVDVGVTQATINSVLRFGFTKTGTGLLILGGTNVLAGQTLQLNAGTVRLNTSTALGNASIALNGGALDYRTSSIVNTTGSLSVLANSGVIISHTASSSVTHAVAGATIGAQTLSLTNSTTSGSGLTQALNFTQDFNLTGDATLTINNRANHTTAFLFGSGFDGGGGSTPFMITLSANANSTVNSVFRIDAASTNMPAGSFFNITSGRLALGGNGTTGTSLATPVGVRMGGANAFFEVRGNSDRNLTAQDVYVTTGNGTIRPARTSAGAGATHTLGRVVFEQDASLTVAPGNAVDPNSDFGIIFSGETRLLANPSFFVNLNGTGTGFLTLGPINDTGTTRAIIKGNAGIMILSAAATTLQDNTQLTLNNGGLRLAANGVLGDGLTNFRYNPATANTATMSTGPSGGPGLPNHLKSLQVNGSGTSRLSFNSATNDHVLRFGSLNATGFTSWTIESWLGVAESSGTAGKIVFTDASAFTPAILNNINFVGFDPGAILIPFSGLGGGSELVPIPEPGAALAFVGIAGIVAIRRRRV
jgi:fibronectin-binding autotransporter adhesin